MARNYHVTVPPQKIEYDPESYNYSKMIVILIQNIINIFR